MKYNSPQVQQVGEASKLIQVKHNSSMDHQTPGLPTALRNLLEQK